MKIELNWARISIESAAIVFSILLAFLIQAAWESRNERVEENLILLALIEELEANQLLLDREIIRAREIQSYATAILEEASKERRNLTGEEVDQLISNTSWWTSPNLFETATIDALSQGGRITAIESEELLRSIAVWQRSIQFFEYVVSQDREFFMRDYMPFMYAYSNLSQISNAGEIEPGAGEPTYVSRVPQPKNLVDHRELLDNQEFLNLMLGKSWIYDDILQNLRDLALALAGVKQAIASEL